MLYLWIEMPKQTLIIMTSMQTGSFHLDSKYASETKENNLSTFTEVLFPSPFPEETKVIVVPMVQTFHGAETPGLRIAKVSPKGFYIRINELTVNPGQTLSDGVHNSERIGWVAFSV